MARKAVAESQYNVGLHRTGDYVYASTQPRRIDPETGKVKYRHVHWGRFDEETMKFHPNASFLALNPEERSKMRFPETWDLQEIAGMSGLPSSERPPQSVTGDRLYGHIWLMERVSHKLGIHDDLLETFNGNRELVDIIFSLAIYPFLTGNSYRRAERWQTVERSPTDKKLTPSFITRITQKITTYERDIFFKLRRNRIDNEALCALDSTSRAAYGDSLSEVKRGMSKDRPDLEQTIEVVVYSLVDHQPIYYRTFQGNIPDVRSFNTIYEDLKKAGFSKLVLITDRGYACTENLEKVINDGTNSLLTAVPINRKLVLPHIKEFGEFNIRPAEMELDIENNIYFKQFKEEYTILEKSGAKKSADNFCINIYLDIKRRSEEILNQDKKIIGEERLLLSQKNDRIHIQDTDEFQSGYKYFDIEFENNTIKSYKKRDNKIIKEQTSFGFFAILTIGIDYDAKQTLDAYKRRDEQEKYFNLMKSYFNGCTQKNSSEDGKIGREFILFIGLAITSYIKYIWNSTELKDIFDASIDIYDEMKSIKLIEEEGKLPRFTPFVGKQLKICEVFGFQVPEGCSPGYTSKRVSKRGRKAKVDA